jgi:hypothetical protein
MQEGKTQFNFPPFYKFHIKLVLYWFDLFALISPVIGKRQDPSIIIKNDYVDDPYSWKRIVFSWYLYFYYHLPIQSDLHSLNPLRVAAHARKFDYPVHY